MYVAPAIRSVGIGGRIVAAPEEEARSLGAKSLVLESGIRQGAVLSLYERFGFERIPLYDEHVLSPATSVRLGRPIAREGEP